MGCPGNEKAHHSTHIKMLTSYHAVAHTSENITEMVHKSRCLLRVLAVLFLEEPLFHFPFLLLDTFPTVDGTEVDEM